MWKLDKIPREMKRTRENAHLYTCARIINNLFAFINTIVVGNYRYGHGNLVYLAHARRQILTRVSAECLLLIAALQSRFS